MNQVEHVLGVQNELGECPIWNPKEQALYWVNIEGAITAHRFDPVTGEHQVYEPDFPITAFGLRESGGWITAARNGLAVWNPHTQDYKFITDPEADTLDVRFNDGVVDHQGRFWAGTLNEANLNAPDGSLYRLDPDGSIHRLDTGFAVANGIGISPDSKTLYLVDMFHSRILAYDHDPATGTLENRRVFAAVPEEAGYPDGITIDSEGFVWNAHWGGWRVTRYDPAGKIEREIRLPVQNVTRCAFGGKQLDELYICTAWYALNEDEKKKQPFAGDLFRVKTEVKGLEEPSFTG
jgi:sugar lactone lactonase YvrE